MNKLYPNHRRTWRRTVTRLSLNGLVSLSAVTGLFIAPSCSTTEPEGGGVETNLRITLAPSITTRVTGTAFDEEDAIGLSVVPWSDGREQPLSSSRWEDNVKFVYRDGQFVSSATAYFPDATTANTFYAYYPYNQTGFRSNTSSLAVAVATDQSDAASRTASDWMVAVTRNVKPDGQAVPVAFRHILSLMQIRMTAGDGRHCRRAARSRGAPQRFLQYGTLRCRCRDIRRAGRRDRHPSLRHDANRGRLRHRPFCRRSPADTRSGRDGHLFYVQRQDNGLQTQFGIHLRAGQEPSLHRYNRHDAAGADARRQRPNQRLAGGRRHYGRCLQTRVALCQRLRWQHLSRHRNQRREVARRQPPHHALQRRHGDTGRRRRHGRMGRTDRARRLHHGE